MKIAYIIKLKCLATLMQPTSLCLFPPKNSCSKIGKNCLVAFIVKCLCFYKISEKSELFL